jgi:ATP-dependent 26S proteasome regulatory subunit
VATAHLEDTGELISVDAAANAGQGLSRMLNVCDGLLGQSLNVLVLITTNEEIGRLHPAVARPGRCLSNVESETFDPIAARRWLVAHGASGSVSRRVTLAELYAQARGSEIADSNRRVGLLPG